MDGVRGHCTVVPVIDEKTVRHHITNINPLTCLSATYTGANIEEY